MMMKLLLTILFYGSLGTVFAVVESRYNYLFKDIKYSAQRIYGLAVFYGALAYAMTLIIVLIITSH